MQLRYLTRCFRSTVTNQPPAPVVVTPVHDLSDSESTQAITGLADALRAPGPPEDPGTLLIDFK
jgi:hypothetical protein